MSGRGPRVIIPNRHLEMQIIFVLLQLVILPSITFAHCPDSVAEVTQTNVTQNSVILNYSVTVNTQCPGENLKICYKEDGGSSEWNCQNSTMNTNSFSDFVTLTDLKSCTTYVATVSIRTQDETTSFKTISFSTKRGVGPVLKTASAEWSSPYMEVKWTTANNFGCGSLFNVTWTSNLTNETDFKTLDITERSATIFFNHRVKQTFVVHVVAVFPDGDTEFLSTTVEADKRSSRSYYRPY